MSISTRVLWVLGFNLCLATATVAQNTGPILVTEEDDTQADNEDGFWRVYIRLLSGPEAATEIERMLGAGLNINEENSNGRSLLGEAVVRNNASVAKMLLSYGADPNHQDRIAGYAPMHEAALRGYDVVAKQLVEFGADINLPDSSKATPLHIAGGNGQFDFVMLLLQDHASLEAKDISDFTPLHAATMYGDPRIVAALLHAGADVAARAKGSWDLPGGMTPLHIAARQGNLTICKLLIEAGAYVNAVDDDGRTALNHAYEFEHHGVVNFLVESGAQF